jgi:hypothetical protein
VLLLPVSFSLASSAAAADGVSVLLALLFRNGRRVPNSRLKLSPPPKRLSPRPRTLKPVEAVVLAPSSAAVDVVDAVVVVERKNLDVVEAGVVTADAAAGEVVVSSGGVTVSSLSVEVLGAADEDVDDAAVVVLDVSGLVATEAEVAPAGVVEVVVESEELASGMVVILSGNSVVVRI